MENKVLLENSAPAPAIAPAKALSEKQLYENIIKGLEEIRIVLSVKPKQNPENNEVFTIELILKEEFWHLFTPNYLKRTLNLENCSKDEHIEKLKLRYHILGESYKILSARVVRTLDNLRTIFDPEQYIFDISDKITKPQGCRPFPLDESTKIKKELDEAINNSHPSDEVLINIKKEKLDEPNIRKLSYLQPETSKRQNTGDYPIYLATSVIIGPNGTNIEIKDYEGLQLKGAPGATRLLCDLIFGDNILGSHSLTGNQSPAFRGRERPPKKPLDALKIADITHLVCSKFNVNPQLVRGTITTKCADSAKKLKRLLSKTIDTTI